MAAQLPGPSTIIPTMMAIIFQPIPDPVWPYVRGLQNGRLYTGFEFVSDTLLVERGAWLPKFTRNPLEPPEVLRGVLTLGALDPPTDLPPRAGICLSSLEYR